MATETADEYKLKIKRRIGRPRIGEEEQTWKALRPWVKLRMSERTWYRRRREVREAQSNA